MQRGRQRQLQGTPPTHLQDGPFSPFLDPARASVLSAVKLQEHPSLIGNLG
jgi:hypothetical protein